MAEPGGARPRVLVTRAQDDARPLSEALRTEGLAPVLLPLIAFERGASAGRVAATIAVAEECWLALTSPRAAQALAGELPLPPWVRVASVGAATTAALAALGVAVDLEGEGGAAELVARFAALRVGAGPRTVVWPAGDRALPELGRGLTALGYKVVPLEVYRTVLVVPPAAVLGEALEDLAAAIFASPSAVHAFAALPIGERLAVFRRDLLCVASGRTTLAALAAAGFARVASADAPDPAAVAARTRALLLPQT